MTKKQLLNRYNLINYLLDEDNLKAEFDMSDFAEKVNHYVDTCGSIGS